ncbi:hypothetical protein THARTR1_09551 [Trichoderma harzianum]|uniref:Uncharacterized protein n=1 Tax=Trichoderma harzianum TaxID=5544 RepID=A0A2K0TW76_TRIHA|nr:hypothetical protein THARTR1_09551 [Trichoderma harzianum]
MSGNPETIRCLVDFNPRVLELTHLDTSVILGADKLDKSPLEYAANYGDESTFMLLLPFYTSESANDFRSRAFLAALAGGKLDILKYQLSQGEVAHYNYFLEATKAGFYAAVYLLASYGSEIDNPDVTGESALMIAAREGWNKILKFMVKNGGDLESKDANGQTALALAVKTGNDEGVQVLLQAGAWPEGSINGHTLVVYAASQGRVEIVRLLLHRCVDPYEAVLAAVKKEATGLLEKLSQWGVLPTYLSPDQRQNLVEAAKEAGQSSILDTLESLGD